MKKRSKKPKSNDKLTQIGRLFLIYITPHRLNYQIFKEINDPIHEDYIRESKSYFWRTFLKVAGLTLGGTMFALASTIADINLSTILSRFLILNLSLSVGTSIILTRYRYPDVISRVLNTNYEPITYHKKKEYPDNKRQISPNFNRGLDTEEDLRLYQDIKDIYLTLDDIDPLKELISVNMNYLNTLRQNLKTTQDDAKRLWIIEQIDKIKELLLDIVAGQKVKKELSRERINLFTDGGNDE